MDKNSQEIEQPTSKRTDQSPDPDGALQCNVKKWCPSPFTNYIQFHHYREFKYGSFLKPLQDLFSSSKAFTKLL